jgi:homoserine/homoserine lactone efflux protein
MSLASYISYFLLVLVLVYSPGPMTLFLMASGMRAQLKQIYPLLLGANHAYFFAIIIFSLGLAELLQRNIFLFKFFQIVGIVYLLYLVAVQWRKKILINTHETSLPLSYKKMELYTRGALVALFNPKTILLFTIVFPQFAVKGENYYWQIFILGLTFLALQFSSGCFYAFLGGRINAVIRNPEYQMLINKLSALILLAVAVLLIMRI